MSHSRERRSRPTGPPVSGPGYEAQEAVNMIGTALAQYRILSSLGQGGMGHVYLAQDTRLGRQVAVKVLASTESGSPATQRFLQEARLTSSLNHPNIAHIYEIGESGEI